MKKLVWMVPAMAGMMMVAGCNTARKPVGKSNDPIPIASTDEYEVKESIDGVEKRARRERPQSDTVVVATVDNRATRTVYPVPVATSARETPLPAVAQTTPYVVQKGDTLTKIAQEHGLRWQDVAAVNQGVDPNRLRVNQVIYLPGAVDVKVKRAPTPRPLAATSTVKATPVATAAAAGDGTYVVKKGDTLSAIALKQGVKVADLKSVNGLTSDRINEGQKLKLPAKAKNGGETVKIATPPVPLDKPKTPVKNPETNVVPPPPTGVVVQPTITTIVDPPPTPAVVHNPPPAGHRQHTVQPGEDIFSVALLYGLMPVELRELNGIQGVDLVPGTVLNIPPPVVQPAP